MAVEAPRWAAFDISTRNLGWAASEPDLPTRPAFGLFRLPGPRDRGALYAAVRNSLTDIIEQYRPHRVFWCKPFSRDNQSAGEQLNGVAAIAYLCGHDNHAAPEALDESRVRKVVLGRGSFGLRDARGKIIKGTGTPQAKAAAMAFCERQGWCTDSDDVADALVLWEYHRMRAQ